MGNGAIQITKSGMGAENGDGTEQSEVENGMGRNGLEYKNCQKYKHVNGRRVWNKDYVILNKTYEKGSWRNAENISRNAEMVGAEPR